LFSLFSLTTIILPIYKGAALGNVSKSLFRLSLEASLFYAMFIGRSWAKSVLTILLILGLFLSILLITVYIEKSYEWILVLILAIYMMNTDKMVLIP
jgi:hypothetical protein